jgi:enterochelin esterase-like enzyme
MKRLSIILFLFISLNNTSAQSTAKGKVIVKKFLAVSIQGNHGGENPMRRLTIYLPPGYEESKKRYPVIYFLHGFPIDDSICMADFHFQDLLDQAIASSRMNPMIVVLPNSYTHFRGSLYTNSSLTGNWSDFIAKDVVQYVDKNFRTIPDRMSRGLAGHSMGGHGALKIGMLYSDTFSAVYALSPGGLNWGPYLNIGNAGFKKVQFAKNEQEIFNGFDSSLLLSDFATNKDFYAMLFTVFARAFAPDETNLPFYGALPVHYVGDSMVVNVTILKKWEENFPYNMIDTHIAALKRLTALKLDWGRNDEIPFIAVTCIQLSKKLEAYGIDHFAEEYLGDHGSKIGGSDGRINTEMLPFFNTYLKVEDHVKISAKKK